MSSNTKLCVIIPVHKPLPCVYELISLTAAKIHLNSYNCYLVYPLGMDASTYTNAFPALKLQAVNPAWLSSVEQYNKLKLSRYFYGLFLGYEYMLTYELDAYIFHSDFESFGAFKFDFIGAPFFEGYWEAKAGTYLVKGCNSGFSVRNIQSCIKILNSMDKFKTRWFFYKLVLSHSSKLRVWLNRITGYKYDIYVTGKFGFQFAGFHLNEDVIWSEVVPVMFPNFKVADPMSALKFSFEYNLTDSLRLNRDELPLGCHAWPKHLDFWAQYIY